MDPMEPLLACIDDIWKLAYARCGNTADADDLTQETYLAALTTIRRGRKIQYPKTWLSNTLMHLWNNQLREKYRMVTVTYTEGIPEPAEENVTSPEEENDLRSHIASLTKLYRDVIVLHYIGGLTVEKVAERLAIPAGTVKRRLHDGREKIRKGKEKMETKELERITPMRVSLSWTGMLKNHAALEFAGSNLMQQILAAAYEKPLTMEEIAEACSIPVYFIEDMVEKAADMEILAETSGGKYYTDAYLQYPDELPKLWEDSLHLAEEHMEVFAECLRRTEEQVNSLPCMERWNHRQQEKLRRFAFLETLQNSADRPEPSIAYPNRKDGGTWMLLGMIYPLGWTSSFRADCLGGHRMTSRFGKYWLHEFDTSLWDSPNKYGSHTAWMYCIPELIDSVYRHVNPLENQVPADLVENIQWFADIGYFAKENNTYTVDIPVMTKTEYDRLTELCQREAEALQVQIREYLQEFVKAHKLHVPAHLGETGKLWKSKILQYYEPAVYRTLFNAGLHLQNVDYPCPGSVFVLE